MGVYDEGGKFCKFDWSDGIWVKMASEEGGALFLGGIVTGFFLGRIIPALDFLSETKQK